MLPEFRYFSKYFRVKIGNIAKLIFINQLEKHTHEHSDLRDSHNLKLIL